MKKSINFTTVERVQSFKKTLVNPLVEAVGHAETNGFPLFRPFPKGTAYQNQWQKYRSKTLIHDRRTLAIRAAMQSSISLLNHLRRAFYDLLPANEPKLNYTDTSFDAIKVRVSQFSLGGRGLTYFFLTYFLPFLILCNS